MRLREVPIIVFFVVYLVWLFATVGVQSGVIPKGYVPKLQVWVQEDVADGRMK